jgi:hypothetical protein
MKSVMMETPSAIMDAVQSAKLRKDIIAKEVASLQLMCAVLDQ